jgi:uncharacterized membrane protein YoaT (DUF817 family)
VHLEGLAAAIIICTFTRGYIFDMPFLITKLTSLLLLTRGFYSFLVSEERRHTLHLGVSIGVPCRKVPGLIFTLINCRAIDGR